MERSLLFECERENHKRCEPDGREGESAHAQMNLPVSRPVKWVSSYLLHRLIQGTECDHGCESALETRKQVHLNGAWLIDSASLQEHFLWGRQTSSPVHAPSLGVAPGRKQIELAGRLKFDGPWKFLLPGKGTLHTHRDQNPTFLQRRLISMQIRRRLQAPGRQEGGGSASAGSPVGMFSAITSLTCARSRPGRGFAQPAGQPSGGPCGHAQVGAPAPGVLGEGKTPSNPVSVLWRLTDCLPFLDFSSSDSNDYF